MKNGGEETLTFALSLYYSFPFWFDAIKTEQQPHEKLCSDVSLLHRSFHSSIDRNFLELQLLPLLFLVTLSVRLFHGCITLSVTCSISSMTIALLLSTANPVSLSTLLY
ncbi:hypothetical protein IGI04_003127 [Brassica rapa subsp. trilocularis]|uniref:Uncharacterized protein n=1 Tax=Brassica rapa subsp. trilocularis TaxID=1813537 RepID=A0ABQ7NXJ4_BRACM|nr:hypothetical protein IGI04_003127 [Brassica rapa subsp. trilocularis]